MIHAYWLFPALIVGAMVGYTVCALCKTAKDN